MLRTAFLKALNEAQRLGRIAAPDANAKLQWYDQLEKTPKFSGPLGSVGNLITEFEDKTGLIKLGALGAVGYGGLEALGGVGASGGVAPTAAEGSAIADGMTTAAGAGTEAMGGGMWEWLDGLDIGMGDVPGYGGGFEPSFDPTTVDLGFGGVDFPGYGGVTPDMVMQPAGGGLWGTLSKYGSQAANGLRSLFGGNASGGGTSPVGFDFGQAAFNSTPFLLALAESDRQSDDIDDVLRKINGPAYTNAVVNPYDLETGTGRTALMEDQQARGVRGSSFGQQSLNNYDYMRGLGRGDLVSRATMAPINMELNAINQRNLSRNLLLGAGLNASGRLFAGPEADPFGLKRLGLT